METLKKITHELAFGSRKSKVKLIQELASDEFETPQSVFELAQKNKKQINAQLSSLFDYYSEEVEKQVKRAIIFDSYYESFPRDVKFDIDAEFEEENLN